MSRASEILDAWALLQASITAANGYATTVKAVRDEIDFGEEIATTDCPLVMFARGDEEEDEGASGRINARLPVITWMVISNPDHTRAPREAAIADQKKAVRADVRLGSFSGGGFLADNINLTAPVEPFIGDDEPLEFLRFEWEVAYHYQSSSP